jgi:hypothetical protein
LGYSDGSPTLLDDTVHYSEALRRPSRTGERAPELAAGVWVPDACYGNASPRTSRVPGDGALGKWCATSQPPRANYGCSRPPPRRASPTARRRSRRRTAVAGRRGGADGAREAPYGTRARGLRASGSDHPAQSRDGRAGTGAEGRLGGEVGGRRPCWIAALSALASLIRAPGCVSRQPDAADFAHPEAITPAQPRNGRAGARAVRGRSGEAGRTSTLLAAARPPRRRASPSARQRSRRRTTRAAGTWQAAEIIPCATAPLACRLCFGVPAKHLLVDVRPAARHPPPPRRGADGGCLMRVIATHSGCATGLATEFPPIFRRATRKRGGLHQGTPPE